MNFSPLTLASILIFWGASAAAQNANQMNYLASATTKVTAAVNSTVKFRDASELLSGEELLRLSVAEDPAVLIPLKQYVVRVTRTGRNSALLVCSSNGQVALLEDAGCTPGMDVHHWNSSKPQLCEFSLNLDQVCTAR